MASLSNINGIFDVHSTGAILFSTSHGTSGQILRSNGNAAPTWVAASTVIGGPYLPLTGGTLTGPLSGTSATFTGNVLLGSNNDIPMDASASGQLMVDGVGYQGAIALDDQAMYIYHNSSGRNLVLGTNETARLTIGGSGNSTFAGDIMPAAENLYDIGSASVRWENIWADQVYGRSVYVDGNIYHNGDTDTYITFAADRQTYLAGGDEFIDFREATESYITIGNSNDTDTRMQGGAGYIFIQGSNGYIGINDGTPSYPLDINGNTYLSGNLQITSFVIVQGNLLIDSDSSELKLGEDQDAQMYHNGSHLFIDNGTGSSYIRNTSTGDILLRNSTGGDIQFDNEFAGNILFNTSNVERMRIQSNGSVQVAGKTIINSTSNYTSNAGSLSVNNATNINGGVVDTHGNGNARYYTRVAQGSTGLGSAGYWHIKTNMLTSQYIMFLAKFYGYIYGQSAVLDLQHTGYAYAGTSVINQGTTNNGTNASASSAVYLTAAQEVCFRIDMGGSTYYAGVWMDISFQNPTGGTHNLLIQATAWSTTVNYYT